MFVVMGIYLLLIASMAMPALLPVSLTVTALAIRSRRRRYLRARAKEAARLHAERQQLEDQCLDTAVRYFAGGAR